MAASARSASNARPVATEGASAAGMWSGVVIVLFFARAHPRAQSSRSHGARQAGSLSSRRWAPAEREPDTDPGVEPSSATCPGPLPPTCDQARGDASAGAAVSAGSDESAVPAGPDESAEPTWSAGADDSSGAVGSRVVSASVGPCSGRAADGGGQPGADHPGGGGVP